MLASDFVELEFGEPEEGEPHRAYTLQARHEDDDGWKELGNEEDGWYGEDVVKSTGTGKKAGEAAPAAAPMTQATRVTQLAPVPINPARTEGYMVVLTPEVAQFTSVPSLPKRKMGDQPVDDEDDAGPEDEL